MKSNAAALIFFLCSIIFQINGLNHLQADPAVIVDGSPSEWGSLDAEQFIKPASASTGIQIASLSVHRKGEFFFFLMTFQDSIDTNPKLRYFINFNTDDNNISDFQAAVSHGTKGDTSRFKKDWSTYDFKTMDTAPGFKSAMGSAVEFQIPVSMFKGRNAFGFTAGVWDTSKAIALDSFRGYYTKLKIHYTLTVLDPGKHLVKIDAKFTGFPDEYINLHFPPNYPQAGEITVKDLKAAGSDRVKLDISRKKSTYLIKTGKSAKEFSLSYMLAMNMYHDSPVRGPAGYLCKSYMLTSTCWSLISPVTEEAREYRLTLNLPEGWVPVVPWKKSGAEFIETDTSLFRQTTFGAGLFDIQKKWIAGTEVTVAVDSHFDEKFRNELFKNSFMSFAFIKSIFNAQGPAAHLSIFAKPEGENEWQSFNENGLSQGEAVNDMNSAVYQFTHRVFHSFNAFYPAGMDIEPTWFLEGVNEYYCALAKIKAGTEAPLHSLSDFYFNEYIKKRAKLDAPLIGNTRFPADWEKENFLAYKKGALAALLLDIEIRRLSDHKASLNDLISAIYKTHGQFKGIKVTDEIIEKTASMVTGKDMKPFFNKYIYTDTKYDMVKLFSDDNSNGICNAAEEIILHLK